MRRMEDCSPCSNASSNSSTRAAEKGQVRAASLQSRGRIPVRHAKARTGLQVLLGTSPSVLCAPNDRASAPVAIRVAKDCKHESAGPGTQGCHPLKMRDRSSQGGWTDWQNQHVRRFARRHRAQPNCGKNCRRDSIGRRGRLAALRFKRAPVTRTEAHCPEIRD